MKGTHWPVSRSVSTTRKNSSKRSERGPVRDQVTAAESGTAWRALGKHLMVQTGNSISPLPISPKSDDVATRLSFVHQHYVRCCRLHWSCFNYLPQLPSCKSWSGIGRPFPKKWKVLSHHFLVTAAHHSVSAAMCSCYVSQHHQQNISSVESFVESIVVTGKPLFEWYISLWSRYIRK